MTYMHTKKQGTLLSNSSYGYFYLLLAEGQLHCMFFVTTGDTTYVTVYNKDSSTPDELTTFSFSCYVSKSN